MNNELAKYQARIAELEYENSVLREAIGFSTPTIRQEYNRRGFIKRFAEFDWLDDPQVLRSALNEFIEEAHELTHPRA